MKFFLNDIKIKKPRKKLQWETSHENETLYNYDIQNVDTILAHRKKSFNDNICRKILILSNGYLDFMKYL